MGIHYNRKMIYLKLFSSSLKFLVKKLPEDKTLCRRRARHLFMRLYNHKFSIEMELIKPICQVFFFGTNFGVR